MAVSRSLPDPLPETTYYEWVHYIRPAIEEAARKSHCLDDEDVASEVIDEGAEILYTGRWDRNVRDYVVRPNAFDSDTGREGLQKWLLQIAGFRIRDWHRRHRREAARRVPLNDETVEEARVAAWLSERPDPDLLEDAILRLEAASINEIQRSCLAMMLAGWSIDRTARHLGIPQSRVHYNRSVAIRALKAVNPNDVTAAADLDRYLWRAANWPGGFRITVYHKPLSTGSGLATQDLRDGTCSVTRRQDIL